MIPKIIHYCWFGGPLPTLAKKCIASWEKFCPDYEIKRWDETSFDVNCCEYVQEAYKTKMWAFVSDYARFDILYKYGGVYFDTDVELLKSIDGIIEKGNFMGCEVGHIENELIVSNGVNKQCHFVAAGFGLGANSGLGLYEEILEDYNKAHFINQDGSLNLYTVVQRVTKLLEKYGFDNNINNNEIQKISKINIYPPEYFSPKNCLTGEVSITNNTISIHHYEASWYTINKKISVCIKKYIKGYPGKIIAFPFTFFDRLETEGFDKTKKYYLKRILNI